MRGDNRGMTLMEMMVAATMSVIIIGAAGLFMQSALKGYQSAANAVDFQMESQVLMEQLGTWIMEGNRIAVSAYSDADGTERNVLTIYKIPTAPVAAEREVPGFSSAGNDTSKRVIWQHEDGLYMKEISGIADADSDTTVIDYNTEAVRECCVSEYIEEFVLTYDPAKPNTVSLSFKLSRGTQEYEMSNEFKIRNELK